MPVVSIITPAYNAELFIEQTINSVQKQTFSDWEMIVVDDGSTDNTAVMVKAIAEIDHRIKYFYQQNGRQGKARNLAIENAKGEFLAFLDADDLWESTKLEKQIQVIEQEKCDLVYTTGYVFSENTNNVVKKIQITGGAQNSKELIIKQLWGYSFPILSVLVKKEFVVKVGGFSENPKVQNAEDYQLWIKLTDAGLKIYGMQEELFYYRVHPAQATQADSLAFTQCIWALDELKLNTVSKSIINQIMNQRVNRYLLHEFELINNDRRREIIELYRRPLGLNYKYLLCKFLYALNERLLFKWGYRFFNSSETA